MRALCLAAVALLIAGLGGCALHSGADDAGPCAGGESSYACQVDRYNKVMQ